MADLISIPGIIEVSLSLILQCSSIAKSLNDLAAKFREAQLHLFAMAHEIETIDLAWTEIKKWDRDMEVTFFERLDTMSIDENPRRPLRRPIVRKL